jgi:tetratricopeptide (TPR) repeat protein
MKPRTPLLITLGVVAVAAVAAVGIWKSRAVISDLPADLDQVAPSAEFADAEASADYYRARVRRDPDDVESRVRLAQVLLQLASSTGRATEYVPEAKETLDAALARNPDHYYALTLQASLLNTLHQFEGARDLSERLLRRFPAHAYTHGTLIDALVELGEYDEATRVSDRLQALRPGLPAYSRASYLRELHGDTEGAIEAMRLAADAEPGGRLGRAWALLNLGNLYLGMAKPDTAAFLFEGLLEERPDFAPAVAALGHVALVKGDAAGAVRRLEEARAMSPLETTDELLVSAYTALGDERKAREAADRVLAGLHAAREMGEVVDMEEADFLADADRDLDRALQLATVQIRRRPGHLHANETYAWALYKNGRAADAVPFIQRAMRLDTGDAMVHYRAGRIYEAAGRSAGAAEQYRLALAAHVGVESPEAAADARRRLAGTPQRAVAPAGPTTARSATASS